MTVNHVTYNPILHNNLKPNDELKQLVNQIGNNVKLPDETRNFATYDTKLADKIIAYKQEGVVEVGKFLNKATTEKQIVGGLFILDRMIEADVKGVEKLYPVISKFNNTTSPTAQSLLAGIYRKTQVPDAFGPLMKMMIRNSLLPQCPYFDPTEEIGGAILDYVRAKGAVHKYSENSLIQASKK